MTEPQTYKIHKSKDGLYYWTVQAENGEVLATSETYERVDGARKGAVAAGATNIRRCDLEGPVESGPPPVEDV